MDCMPENIATAAGDRDSAAFSALISSKFAELFVWAIPDTVMRRREATSEEGIILNVVDPARYKIS